jgi:hypothetical protein
MMSVRRSFFPSPHRMMGRGQGEGPACPIAGAAVRAGHALRARVALPLWFDHAPLTPPLSPPQRGEGVNTRVLPNFQAEASIEKQNGLPLARTTVRNKCIPRGAPPSALRAPSPASQGKDSVRGAIAFPFPCAQRGGRCPKGGRGRFWPKSKIESRPPQFRESARSRMASRRPLQNYSGQQCGLRGNDDRFASLF